MDSITADINDFSDLAEVSNKFKYKGKLYGVPPLTREIMTALLRINKKMSAQIKESSPSEVDSVPSEVPPKLVSPESLPVSDKELDNVDNMFKLQQDFVHTGIREITDDGQLLEIDEKELEKWPMKLLTKNIRFINTALSEINKGDETPT
jgi:hypothetical protein